MLEMNDIILIFIGVFVILLIFLFFMLVAYVYDTYTSYKVDINKNLTKSEDHINETTKTIDDLKDNVSTDLGKIKTTHETLEKSIKTNETKYNTFTSNLNHLLRIDNITKNNIGCNLFDDNITAYDKTNTDLNLLANFNIWEDAVIRTNSNNSNYLNICDNAVGDNSKLSCASMNVHDKIFNIYSSNTNFNSSNINKIQIHGKKNDDTMIEFDIANNNIYIGSNVNPAISINNNIYTPPTIIGYYLISGSTLTLNYFTNITIPTNAFVNFYIPTSQTLSVTSSAAVNNINYTNNLLKFKNNTIILANNKINVDFILTGSGLTNESKTSINGYLTSS